jgi:hypothetical protein
MNTSALKLTPASADVIRGGFFALAKKMTLITVSWMQLLDFFNKHMIQIIDIK